MECNKEEAIRAMQVAEKKLHANDFMGARKMAKLAQRLYPELENVNRLLAVAEVLCSTENKISDLKYDFYGILQIQQTADEETIRKQYRKLALLLHPDKNKFIGAEAAFKLLGEANRLLTDKLKRSLYDMKLRASQNPDPDKLPQPQSNAKKPTKKQEKASNNAENASHSQSSGVNTTKLQAFWTACSFCNMRFQYRRAYVNRLLRCQSCGRGFIAHDLDYHNVPDGSSMGPTPTSNIEVPSGVSLQTTDNNTCVETRDKRAEAKDALKTGKTSELGSDSRAEKRQKCMNANVKGRKGGENSPSGEAKSMGQGESQGAVKKRKRKAVLESIAGDFSLKSEVEFSENIGKSCGVYQENGVDSSAQNAGVTGDRYDQKSASDEQHYFDKENGGNDFGSQKMSKVNKSSGSKAEMRDWAGDIGMSKANNSSDHVNVDGDSDEIEKQSPALAKAGMVEKKRKSGESKEMMAAAATPASDRSTTKTRNADCDSGSKDEKTDTIYAPQPDFSDFDKNRREKLFAAKQIWVVYDINDGMPRFYCFIKKVLSPGFKLEITWLEPNPVNKEEIDWCDEELPVACGRFRLWETQVTSDLLMFSHMKCNIRRSGKALYVIYPSKGETWALFKDWDIGWSSDPTSHNVYKYEYVEVLSDFDEHVGLEVACLYKVTGFVSLFEGPKVSANRSFKVPPNQLYRFSHQVPSYVMTGEERDGVPKGSFELDTAGLPPDLFEHDSASEVKLERR